MTPHQGQLGVVTTALQTQKYFAEAAYLCLARKPVVSGPGEIAGNQRCGEVWSEGVWGVNRSVLGMDGLVGRRMPGVSVLEEDYDNSHEQDRCTRMYDWRYSDQRTFAVRLSCDCGDSDKRLTGLLAW